jgi:hypothetical protein
MSANDTTDATPDRTDNNQFDERYHDIANDPDSRVMLNRVCDEAVRAAEEILNIFDRHDNSTIENISLDKYGESPSLFISVSASGRDAAVYGHQLRSIERITNWPPTLRHRESAVRLQISLRGAVNGDDKE